MISLFLLACQIEFKSIDIRTPVKQFMDEQTKRRTFEDVWVEQCVARKEMGL